MWNDKVYASESEHVGMLVCTSAKSRAEESHTRGLSRHMHVSVHTSVRLCCTPLRMACPVVWNLCTVLRTSLKDMNKGQHSRHHEDSMQQCARLYNLRPPSSQTYADPHRQGKRDTPCVHWCRKYRVAHKLRSRTLVRKFGGKTSFRTDTLSGHSEHKLTNICTEVQHLSTSFYEARHEK